MKLLWFGHWESVSGGYGAARGRGASADADVEGRASSSVAGWAGRDCFAGTGRRCSITNLRSYSVA